MKKKVCYLLFILISLKLFTQDIIVDNGYGKYVDEHYNFVILLVSDINKAIRIWKKPRTPNIFFKNKFKRGESVSPFIMFSTDSKDSNGNANIIYNFELVKPDNSATKKEGLIIIQDEAPSPDKYDMLYQYISIKFDNEAILGTYHMLITIKDTNSNFEKTFDFIIYLTE